MNQKYSKKVMQHFLHPRNMGKIKNPDGVGKVGNPLCGDILWIYIKIGKNKNREEIVEDIKFQTFGCAAAISVSSVLTEMVKGKTLKQVEKISNKDIVKELGGLPPIKHHCSLLGTQALKKAIDDYKKSKQKKKKK